MSRKSSAISTACGPFENVKTGPRERSTSLTKHELADHKLEQMEKSGRDVRRRCAGCYEKIRLYKSKEGSKNFRPDCEKLYCLGYFNAIRHVRE